MDEQERRPATYRGEDDAREIDVGQKSVEIASAQDSARRARFLEALDRVMSKCDNVLAALAK